MAQIDETKPTTPVFPYKHLQRRRNPWFPGLSQNRAAIRELAHVRSLIVLATRHTALTLTRHGERPPRASHSDVPVPVTAIDHRAERTRATSCDDLAATPTRGRRGVQPEPRARARRKREESPSSAPPSAVVVGAVVRRPRGRFGFRAARGRDGVRSLARSRARSLLAARARST